MRSRSSSSPVAGEGDRLSSFLKPFDFEACRGEVIAISVIRDPTRAGPLSDDAIASGFYKATAHILRCCAKRIQLYPL